jgi:hypothetical protein
MIEEFQEEALWKRNAKLFFRSWTPDGSGHPIPAGT